ncbi:hypothetical protein SAMN05880501_11310 [Ureibacillus xyleni]|uniref:TrbL/VirB6 plasmid conjugal transfer protein n=1 Tax=Ureibacillus xyleni TaxID=614648 RepID=A0A285THA8_9BACL|nr:hypothetical protein [Ureibacillus xyleni]SOC21539.1 hypothetical protein SAMN05880501_11310 [Ureibacillus xyleni]
MKVLLKITSCMLLLLLSFLTYPTPEAFAEDEMFEAEYGEYKEEGVHYQIDIITDKELEKDKGFFGSVFNVSNIGEGVMSAIYFVFFKILELSFSFNLFMTNLMISILDFSYDVNIINELIDSMSSTVVNMTGLSGGTFSASGLFGAFSGLIALCVALYTLYQFVVNRASIKAFSGLLKSVVAFTVALGFFANYSTFLKGAHTISNEFSTFIISGSAGDMLIDESGNVQSISVQEKMYDNLFNTFVHKPYLLLQYGQTTGIEQERIKKLLELDPQLDAEKRSLVVKEEVVELGNDTFTYESIWKRYNYAGVMVLGNAISSIPVYLLALSLLLFQFWFLIIAMVAPFALLWSALPGQFGVLKRYLFELALPLVLKSIVSIGALLIFGLTEVIYSLSALAGGGSKGLVLSIVLQTILMMAMFLLRKRIGGIFTKGSTQLGLMREQINGAFINPTKKAIQMGTAVTAGTVAAIATGGALAPTLFAANVGKDVGKLATGDAGLGETGMKLATAAAGYKLLSNKQSAKKLDKLSQASIQEFANANQLSDIESQALAQSLHSKGLSNVSVDEIDEAKANFIEDYEAGNTNDESINEYIANGIARKRNAETSSNLVNHNNQVATLGSRAEQMDRIHAKQLLKNEIGASQTEDLYQELNNRHYNNMGSTEVEKYLHEYRLEANESMTSGQIPRSFKEYVVERVQYKQISERFESTLNDNSGYLKKEHIEMKTIEKVEQLVRNSSRFDEQRGVLEVKVTKKHLKDILHKYDDYLNGFSQSSINARSSTLTMDQYVLQEVQTITENKSSPVVEIKTDMP